MSDDFQHVINVSDGSVSIGPLARDLIPIYQRWNNEVSTSQTLGLSWPTTLESETSVYEQRVADPAAIYFTVFERATSQPIGIAYLYEISERHSRASYGIVIGEPTQRGKGYGTAATRLVLDYAFNSLGLENVLLTVVSFNTAGIRAYEKAGFTVIGTRHRCSRIGGELHDLVYMQCLAGDFRQIGPQTTMSG